MHLEEVMTWSPKKALSSHFTSLSSKKEQISILYNLQPSEAL